MEQKKELKQELGYRFWLRVDEIRAERDLSLLNLSKMAGLSYGIVKNQRTNNVIPKLIDSVLIAKALNTSCEYLATGTRTNKKTEEYLYFIDKLEKEDPEKLRVVRELLGINKGGSSSNSGTRVG